MKLHRTLGRPDWEGIPPAERTVWQRIAARTSGVVTPGNLLTAIGIAAVVYGLWCLGDGRYWAGLGLVTFGRLLDLADGWAADQTLTKGPLGELLDASVDKLATLLTLITLGATGIAPWWAMAVLLVPQALAAAIAGLQRARGKTLHPSRLGKLSMAGLWLALVLFIGAQAAGGTGWLMFFAYTAAAVSTAAGFVSAIGYLRDTPKVRSDAP